MSLLRKLFGASKRPGAPGLPPIRTVAIPGCGESSVAEFSPDGGRLLVAWDERPVQLWDLARGDLVRSFDAGDMVESLAFAPDGDTIFGSNNVGEGEEFLAELTLWDAETGQPRWTVRHGLSEVYLVRFTWDARQIVLAPEEPFLTVLDAKTGAELRRIDTGGEGAFGLEVSPDGENVLAMRDDEARLWRLADGAPRWTFEAEDVYAAAFSPGGDLVAMGTSKGEVILVDAASGERVRQWNAGVKCIGACLFDGPTTLLTGAGFSDEGAHPIRRWDVTNGRELQAFASVLGPINTFELGREGRTFWATGSESDEACEWALPS